MCTSTWNARYGTFDWTWRRIGFRTSRGFRRGRAGAWGPGGAKSALGIPGGTWRTIFSLAKRTRRILHGPGLLLCRERLKSQRLVNTFQRQKTRGFCYIAKNPTICLFGNVWAGYENTVVFSRRNSKIAIPCGGFDSGASLSYMA